MNALLQIVCLASLLSVCLIPNGCAAEIEAPRKSAGQREGERSQQKGELLWERNANSFFGLTNLWTIHLTIQPADWDAMEPAMGRGRGGGRGPFELQVLQQGGRVMRQRGGDVVISDARTADAVARGLEPVQVQLDGPVAPAARGPARGPMMGPGGHNQQFAFAPGLFEFEGKTFGKVAVRFKGNSSFASSRQVLKRSFKIDFNDYVKGQRFFGLTKLSLNCNAMDQSQIKEVLSYAVFQRAGVTSARTALAKVYLTVPGKYDRQYLGLYTLIEQVDERFLQDRFGTREGLLLKPEGAGGLQHFGETWDSYVRPYDAQTQGTPAEQKRFIEFTKFVRDADEPLFREKIASYLDVDQFLRHLAVTVVLANMDSILGMHHNFYLYVHPQSHKVQCFPWDLNLSMGQGGGNPDLSIMRPSPGGNNFIPRLLAIKEFQNVYRRHMQSVLATAFKPETVHADIDAIVETVREAVAREERIYISSVSNAGPRPGPVGSPVGQRDLLKQWVTQRAESVALQLDGKSEGWIPPNNGNRGGARGAVAGPSEAGAVSGLIAMKMFQAADANQDGRVSRDEFKNLAAEWFGQWNAGRDGKLDEIQLATGLNLMITRPARLLANMPLPRVSAEILTTMGPGRMMAASLMTAADADKDARLTEKEFASALAKWFDHWRADGNPYLGLSEIRNGLRNTLGSAPADPVLIQRGNERGAPRPAVPAVFR